MAVGDSIEYRKHEGTKADGTPKTLWFPATIERIEEEKGVLHLKIDSRSSTQTNVCELDSEEICKLGTHLKKDNVAQSRSSWAKNTRGSSYGSSPGGGGGGGGLGYGSNRKRNMEGRPPAAGAVGLSNIGNTCYMNSVLQCLSKAGALREFFLENWRKDLNRDNALGAKGEVAEAFASFINDLWSGTYKTIVPVGVKTALARFQSQFLGYEQHDANEFMMFLMDGVHEDLNRIIKVESNRQDEPNQPASYQLPASQLPSQLPIPSPP